MSDLISAWAGFVIVLGAAILVTLGALIWIIFFRKKRRRRRRRRRQHISRQQPNPTLAQISGLPPVRKDEKLSGPPPPTLTSQS